MTAVRRRIWARGLILDTSDLLLKVTMDEKEERIAFNFRHFVGC